MNVRQFKPITVIVAVAVLIGATYVFRSLWLPWIRGTDSPDSIQSATSSVETASPTGKIIVSDQAQQNLGLTARPLKAETFWKTITVQGMIVDRPGVSDREIVAPATAVVAAILHVYGDTVRPGDELFTLKLTSDELNKTQAELFKTTEEIKLADARLKRLKDGGTGVVQARVIEAASEVARLEAAAKAYEFELLHRGLTRDDIDRVTEGKLVSEILVTVPVQPTRKGSPNIALVSETANDSTDDSLPTFELQELNVEMGQQVQAGETLCQLSNHRLLAIEGRAFRDETPLLERSVNENWPVEVDFQEENAKGWSEMERTFPIRHIANTIDPTTRTFAFLIPLENQSRAVVQGDRTQLLWRYRPGQRVRIHVRIDKLDNVFVLPADAVVREGAEVFIFTQNVNTFERKGVHVLFQDRDRAVLANDGSLPTFKKGDEIRTIPAVAQNSAAQLNRMAKAGSSGVPKGYHIHADGSLHKNEDEAK
jgi:membrane fusion protein, heavy metal efflux system